jgi:hypothetical protein
VVSVASSFYPYKHMNFSARSSKEGSGEHLFFAELQLCSRRKNPIGFSIICCEPLGSYSTGKFYRLKHCRRSIIYSMEECII